MPSCQTSLVATRESHVCLPPPARTTAARLEILSLKGARLHTINTKMLHNAYACISPSGEYFACAGAPVAWFCHHRQPHRYSGGDLITNDTCFLAHIAATTIRHYH